MDDDVTAAVRAFRAATTTTRGDAGRRRVWRSIEAQTVAHARTESSRTTLAIGVAALAIAAALVLAFGRVRSDEAVRERSQDRDQAIDAADRGPEPRAIEASVVVPAELDPSALPRETKALPVETNAPIARPTARAIEEQPLEAPVITAPERLKREAALLRRAREAMLAHDRAAARAALDAHTQQFPRGELAPERWTLSIELACVAGQRDVAARAAAAFANAHPDVASAKTLRDRPCDSMTNQPASGQSSAGAR